MSIDNPGKPQFTGILTHYPIFAHLRFTLLINKVRKKKT